jgi:hypothetical protein
MKKMIIITVGVLLIAYLAVRINTTNKIDKYSDSFFADFSNMNKEQLKNQIRNCENVDETLAIIERNKDAIKNFDYKNSKPNLNLMLNIADIEPSWHLTIVYKKKNKNWCLAKFDEYTEN